MCFITEHKFPAVLCFSEAMISLQVGQTDNINWKKGFLNELWMTTNHYCFYCWPRNVFQLIFLQIAVNTVIELEGVLKI